MQRGCAAHAPVHAHNHASALGLNVMGKATGSAVMQPRLAMLLSTTLCIFKCMLS